MATAADEMREIAKQEVRAFAGVLAEEFLSIPTTNGNVSAAAFWLMFQRVVARYERIEVPA